MYKGGVWSSALFFAVTQGSLMSARLWAHLLRREECPPLFLCRCQHSSISSVCLHRSFHLNTEGKKKKVWNVWEEAIDSHRQGELLFQCSPALRAAGGRRKIGCTLYYCPPGPGEYCSSTSKTELTLQWIITSLYFLFCGDIDQKTNCQRQLSGDVCMLIEVHARADWKQNTDG